MKKFNKILFMSVMTIVALILVSCGDPITRYEVKFNTNGGNTINAVKVDENKSIELPTPVKDGYEFDGWFLEESLVNEFTSSDPVTKDLTLYAKWNEEKPNTRIVVYTVSPREEFVLFENNKAEKTNKRTEFIDRDNDYVVGDDNPWVVKPVVSFVELDIETGELVNAQPRVDSWTYKISLEVYNSEDTKWEAVNAEEYADHIDETNCTIDFSEKAIGSKVRVSIVPEGLTENQLKDVDKYTVSFECTVEDGFNAYTGLDLAYMETRGETTNPGKAWVAFKESKGLDVDYKPTAIFLHDNIEIKVSDLPQYFFYTKEEVAGASDASRAEGSLKDSSNVYLRSFEKNNTFHLCGNYYTLSAENIPVVVRENGQITEEGDVISHATLIRFETTVDGDDQGSSASFSNLNLVGNAPRVENAIKSGGLILNKTENVTFVAHNNIAYAWFITYMPNYTSVPYTIDSCKGYDSYNSLIYNWGSPELYIRNSEFVGAGGPVIIQDHVESTAEDGGRIAKTYVTNSKLESYVAGSEGWFVGVGAAGIVPGIKALDQLFNFFGRSFLKSNKDQSVTYFNLICVNKSGDAETLTAQKIKGSLKIDDYAAFDFGETNPYIAGLLDTTFSMNAPAFQTSASSLTGGYAYATTSGIFDLQNNQIVDPSNAIYQGEYLCLYYNGMALTLGFNSFDVTNPSAGYEIYE